MTFWPCCCSSCFKPCDCFARNCELHITSEGWTDNAATDCAGIADRVFNKTHVITGMNVTSGPEYGFTCDFTITYDDLILTKEVGGNCICKSQPALYTIEGTLLCARGEDGTYGLSMVLHFKVPVYDEDAGCSPSPCVLEPEWETWTANYVLIAGNLSSSPICDFGANGLGPYSFNTDATAQTTCGLGLDGTDATVTLEWKFCDPIDPSVGACACCQVDESSPLPDTMQVTLAGYANNGFQPDPSADPCEDCQNIDGTYVLERPNGSCDWYGCFDVQVCGAGTPLPVDQITIVLRPDNPTGWWDGGTPDSACAMFLYVVGTSDGCFEPPGGLGASSGLLLGVFHDNGSHRAADGTCDSIDGLVLDAIPDDYNDVDYWWETRPTGTIPGFWCDFQNVTATITALP